MIRGIQATAGRFHTNQLHILVIEKGCKGPHCVRAATDAGGDDIRQAPLALEKLFARLFTDDLLKVTHHHRERMRTDHRADRVDAANRVLEVFLESRIDSIFQRRGTPRHGHQVTAQDLHLGDVRVFLFDIHLTHVNLAWNSNQGAGSGQSHPVLTRTGLGQHLLLTHVLCQQGLADAVIDLVGTGVIEVLTLEIDPRSTELFRQPAGVEQWTRAADIVALQVAQFLLERPGLAYFIIGRCDFIHHHLQFRRDDLTTIVSEIAVLVGHGGGGHMHACLTWGSLVGKQYVNLPRWPPQAH